MERAGTLRYGPEWKCNDGYRIDVETGMAKGCTDSRCTLHFYHALPGDRLALIGWMKNISTLMTISRKKIGHPMTAGDRIFHGSVSEKTFFSERNASSG